MQIETEMMGGDRRRHGAHTYWGYITRILYSLTLMLSFFYFILRETVWLRLSCLATVQSFIFFFLFRPFAPLPHTHTHAHYSSSKEVSKRLHKQAGLAHTVSTHGPFILTKVPVALWLTLIGALAVEVVQRPFWRVYPGRVGQPFHPRVVVAYGCLDVLPRVGVALL